MRILNSIIKGATLISLSPGDSITQDSERPAPMIVETEGQRIFYQRKEYK